MIELVLGLPTTSVLPKLKQNFVRFWYSERSFVVSRELAEIFVGEIPEKVNNQARSTTTSTYCTNNLSSTHNIRDIMFVLHSPLRGFTDLFWKVSTLIYAPKSENTKNSTESIKQTESLLTELNKMICQIPGLGEELIQLLVSMNFTSQNIQILLNSLSDLDKFLGKDIAESQIVEIIADITLKEWEQLDKLMYCKHKINIKLEYSGYQWGLEIEQYKNQQLFYEQLRHFYQLSYTKKLNKAYSNYESAIKKIETSIRVKRKLIEWIFFYWTNKTQECLKNAKDSQSKQLIQRKALVVVKLAAALCPYQVTTNEIAEIEMTLSYFIKDLLILFGFTPIDMFCTTFLLSLRDIVKHGDSFFYYRSTHTPNIWIHIGSNDLLEFTSQRREVLKWLYFAFSRNIFLQQDVGLIITTSSRKEEEKFLLGNDKLNCLLKFCPSRFDINQRNESTSLLALHDAGSIPLNEINTLDELFILFDSLFEILFVGYWKDINIDGIHPLPVLWPYTQYVTLYSLNIHNFDCKIQTLDEILVLNPDIIRVKCLFTSIRLLVYLDNLLIKITSVFNATEAKKCLILKLEGHHDAAVLYAIMNISKEYFVQFECFCQSPTTCSNMLYLDTYR